MSSWVTHLCKGFEGFFFLGEGLQPGGHFFLFTGKSGPITGGLINWGEGLRASLCKILISSFARKIFFAHNFSVDFFK